MLGEPMEPSNFFLGSSNVASLSCTYKIKPYKASYAKSLDLLSHAKDLMNIWSHQLDQLGPHLDLYYLEFRIHCLKPLGYPVICL